MSTNPVNAAIDALTAKVENLDTVEDSLLTSYAGLAQLVKDQAAKIDQNNQANIDAANALNAVGDKIAADAQKMADAVTANT